MTVCRAVVTCIATNHIDYVYYHRGKNGIYELNLCTTNLREIT